MTQHLTHVRSWANVISEKATFGHLDIERKAWSHYICINSVDTDFEDAERIWAEVNSSCNHPCRDKRIPSTTPICSDRLATAAYSLLILRRLLQSSTEVSLAFHISSNFSLSSLLPIFVYWWIATWPQSADFFELLNYFKILLVTLFFLDWYFIDCFMIHVD